MFGYNRVSSLSPAIDYVKSGLSDGNLKGVFEQIFNRLKNIKYDWPLFVIDIAKNDLLDETELAGTLSLNQKIIEKYDEYLPDDLLTECYGLKAFNSRITKQWILSNLVWVANLQIKGLYVDPQLNSTIF